MRKIIIIPLILIGYLLYIPLNAQVSKNSKIPVSKEKLDELYLSSWDKPEYRIANTASGETYLSPEEKEVFYYLNLARIDPPLFAQTYASGYNGDPGWVNGYAFEQRKRSLINTLNKMEPLKPLHPDELLYQEAYCFASKGGKLGLQGHNRKKTGCSQNYNAECCQYGGARNGLSIVMALLIDAGENNGGLEHRKICLSPEYTKMGVSIEPHKTMKFNAILDFGH